MHHILLETKHLVLMYASITEQLSTNNAKKAISK